MSNRNVSLSIPGRACDITIVLCGIKPVKVVNTGSETLGYECKFVTPLGHPVNFYASYNGLLDLQFQLGVAMDEIAQLMAKDSHDAGARLSDTIIALQSPRLAADTD